jgi:hypothetical protein
MARERRHSELVATGGRTEVIFLGSGRRTSRRRAHARTPAAREIIAVEDRDVGTSDPNGGAMCDNFAPIVCRFCGGVDGRRGRHIVRLYE